MLNPQEGFHTYYVYIFTNKNRSTFYIGVTNNLKLRLQQHKDNLEIGNNTFEKFVWIKEAIAREKEIKKWRRDKKLSLVKDFNSDFEFLNYKFE